MHAGQTWVSGPRPDQDKKRNPAQVQEYVRSRRRGTALLLTTAGVIVFTGGVLFLGVSLIDPRSRTRQA
jgi:hypothetical protein